MKLNEMTKLFSAIKAKREVITQLENEIKGDFEKNVIDFFKEKGINFKLINNKFDPINRYYLDTKSDAFKHITYIDPKTSHTVPESLAGFIPNCEKKIDYYPPKFKITPYDFVIKFEWWRSKNQNVTQVYWHPEEMSLEDFYNKKLKKVLNLI